MLDALRGLISVAGADSKLPHRVHIAIAEFQDRSERVIGWIQLFVISVFGIFYFVSPKTAPVSDIFQPVPVVLSIYLVFTVIRLFLSYRIRLPHWFLTVSIIVDMGLLMGLIFSFHIQYQQPPSFFLKAPTLLYVFIFIALRALRFQPVYVILSGVVAAFSWAVMVSFALWSDGMGMITRDYVKYLTSNSVLVGAEVDKILAILSVTLILAVALYRGYQLLEQAIAKRVAHEDLSRFFEPEVADQITHTEQQVTAGTGEEKEASVLVLDIRGFTKLARTLAPADVMTLLAEFQAVVVPVLQNNGGSIDKFLGDGILTTFGATRPLENYAADALRALEAVNEAVDEWSQQREKGGLNPISVGVAVSSGRVIFGTVGHANRLEYTVIGDAVNRCAKLEDFNSRSAIRANCCQATFELAKQQGFVPERFVEEREDCLVAGMVEPISLAIFR